jgi:hypothetical protein
MSLKIYVDAYSGYRANERPHQFVLEEDIFEIEAIEEQWRLPEAAYFTVRTNDGEHYAQGGTVRISASVLLHDETEGEWTLQSDFDGAELFTRSSIEWISVEAKAIREAESQIAACERGCPRCRRRGH